MVRELYLNRNGSKASQTLLFNGYRGSFVGVKRPGRDADQLYPSSAEVKTECSHCSAFPIRLHVVEGTALLFPFHDANGFQTLKCRLHVLECEVGMPKGTECIWQLRALTRTASLQIRIIYSWFYR